MPRKEQRPCDDRNVAWATDKGRFGFQMLEKMGWKEGKGLGANEDGTTEHIKVKKKIDNQGIGTETVTHNKNWLETSVAYESILASLNASYGAKPDTTEEKEKPAEKPKGVVGRPRKVLYSRMLRAKDLANYSSEDKSAIFGGVPYGVAAAAQEEKVATAEVKVQEVGSESEEMEEEESDKKKSKKSKKSADKKEEEDKGEEEEDKETDTVSGVTTTTSAVSLQDYFKMKMAEMARKRGGDVSTPQVSVAVESRQPLQAVASTANEKAEKTDKKKRKREEEEEEETTEEPKKDKKNKKKTKKQEESDAGKSKKEDEKKKNKKKKSKTSKKGEDEQKKKKNKKSKKSKKASS